MSLLFSSNLHITKLLNYKNFKHRNFPFEIKPKENNLLSFLKIKFFRNFGKFWTLTDRKLTFGSFLN